jgi:hypothetical protein
MKIEIGEHCFGSYVIVDGVDICDEEFADKDTQRSLRGALLLEILRNSDNINNYYWKEIADMAVNNNTRYEVNAEESSHDTCEQCGNWNSNTVYEYVR